MPGTRNQSVRRGKQGQQAQKIYAKRRVKRECFQSLIQHPTIVGAVQTPRQVRDSGERAAEQFGGLNAVVPTRSGVQSKKAGSSSGC